MLLGFEIKAYLHTHKGKSVKKGKRVLAYIIPCWATPRPTTSSIRSSKTHIHKPRKHRATMAGGKTKLRTLNNEHPVQVSPRADLGQFHSQSWNLSTQIIQSSNQVTCLAKRSHCLGWDTWNAGEEHTRKRRDLSKWKKKKKKGLRHKKFWSHVNSLQVSRLVWLWPGPFFL